MTGEHRMTTEKTEEILKEKGLLVHTKKRGSSVPVRWVTCDSRKVIPGTVFICKGEAFRTEYLQEAIAYGCVAYISEHSMNVKGNVTEFLVRDVRKAMADVSAAFFGYTPGTPNITGITGTKGKTTTAWYLKAILDQYMQEQGEKETGLISSIENYDGIQRTDAVMTTPESPAIQELICNVKETGGRYVTLETSSQALKYDRVRGICFQVGIFLNIEEDHISPREHPDFEDYFKAKLSIFQQCETACVNLDSECVTQIYEEAKKAKRVVTFGHHPAADVRYDEVSTDGDRISFKVTCRQFTEFFSLKMKGNFNVENAMAAICAAYVYGVPVRCMKRALAHVTVPGRMEVFLSEDKKICAIVDFAHNRLSFKKLFREVFREYRSYTKIITIFGCPGGKALNRRMELGCIAGALSDHIYLTADDPEMEGHEKISLEIREYAEKAGCTCECIADRREAIMEAMVKAMVSGEKTLILVLGRGSEKFQKIGQRLYAYPTDSAIVRELI